MKTLIIIIIGCMLTAYSYGQGRVLERVKSRAGERIDQRTEEGIQKGLDKVEEGIREAVTKEDEKEVSEAEGVPLEEGAEEVQAAGAAGGEGPEMQGEAAKDPELLWAKYDFVPGDMVIFEDNLAGEENGEFPSRWDLYSGNVEVARFGGENVIMFRQYASEIIPYMKNPESDYLPDIFTVEFDLYIPNNYFSVYLYDRKNQNAPRGRAYLEVGTNEMEFSPAESSLPGGENIENRWAHIALACTNGRLKAYINETRLINIPRIDFNPTGISMRALHAGENNYFYIKNIRIAEGGVRYYDRLMQDGKIIANGIRFDVNKATLKPESMGIINEIATLMKEHPEIKFSVEGHTDSDGDDAFNQKLSEQRAETVVGALTKMGIASNRLSSNGWGESKPIDSNGTPEGKANNRRVEFVKK